MKKFIYKYKYLLCLFIFIILFGGFVFIKINLNNNYNKEEVIEEDLAVEEENKSMNEDVDQINIFYVDIKGAVNNPGVYAIEEGKRVINVIDLAAGLRDDADSSLINLSKKVFDEMVIVVYTKDEVIRSNTKYVMDTSYNDAYSDNNDSSVYNEEIDKNSGTSSDNTIININTATVSELMNLDGIGESKAKAIVSYREEHGDFTNIEDLMNVSGIGSSVYEKIKDSITI